MPRFPTPGYTEKTTTVDADKALIADSAATNQIKSTAMSTIWDYIKTKAEAATEWITSTMIAPNAITTSKVLDGAITSAKIGAAEVKSSNIDFATIGSLVKHVYVKSQSWASTTGSSYGSVYYSDRTITDIDIPSGYTVLAAFLVPNSPQVMGVSGTLSNITQSTTSQVIRFFKPDNSSQTMSVRLVVLLG